MKQAFIIIFLLFAWAGAKSATDSKTIKSGKIIFDMSYPDLQLDDKSMESLPDMSVMYFKDNKSKVVISMVGGKSEIISNYDTENSIMIMDLPGNKWYMELSKAELKGPATKTKPVIEKTSDSKTIAGYKCTKSNVKMTTEEGEMKMEIWHTNELKLRNAISNEVEGIEGFMMEYTVFQNSITMKMTFRSIEEMELKDSEFEVPAGFEKKTLEELEGSFNLGR